MDIGLVLSAGGLTCIVGILSKDPELFQHKKVLKKILERLLEVSTGILISVVCFGLLPQTFSKGGVLPGTAGMLVGCLLYLGARTGETASFRLQGWFSLLPGLLLGLTFFSPAGWLTAFCTGVAAGAMLAIVFHTLLLQSRDWNQGRLATAGNIVGMIVGILLTVGI